MPLMPPVCWYLLIANVLAFGVSAFDKYAAKRRGMRRVPEKTLFLLALLGGAAGLYVSMRLFRHKTHHRKFMVGIPVILIAQVALAVWIMVVPW